MIGTVLLFSSRTLQLPWFLAGADSWAMWLS
jgi:hypothetical protein